MNDLSRTSTILLEGLRDSADAETWAMFDERYRPVLLAFAMAVGLRHADAADVAQETMLQFLKEYRAGHYDRTRGRLRTWLIALARSRIALQRRSQARRRECHGEMAIVDLSDDDRLAEIWEVQRRRHILRLALAELSKSARLHERTIRAFELVALRNVPVATVAQQLEMSSHDVYLARSRVMQRLRTIVASLEACFDDGVPAAEPSA